MKLFKRRSEEDMRPFLTATLTLFLALFCIPHSFADVLCQKGTRNVIGRPVSCPKGYRKLAYHPLAWSTYGTSAVLPKSMPNLTDCEFRVSVAGPADTFVNLITEMNDTRQGAIDLYTAEFSDREINALSSFVTDAAEKSEVDAVQSNGSLVGGQLKIRVTGTTVPTALSSTLLVTYRFDATSFALGEYHLVAPSAITVFSRCQ